MGSSIFHMQMRKLRSREKKVRVRYPEGPNTERKYRWASGPFGLELIPSLLALFSTIPFLYPNPGHITKGQRGFWAYVLCCTGQPLQSTGSWGELQTGRQATHQQASVSPFEGERQDTADPHPSYPNHDMAHDCIWPHGEDPMKTLSGVVLPGVPCHVD